VAEQQPPSDLAHLLGPKRKGPLHAADIAVAAVIAVAVLTAVVAPSAPHPPHRLKIRQAISGNQYYHIVHLHFIPLAATAA